jgi:hypothetical protein
MRRRIAALLLPVALLAAACGDDDSSGDVGAAATTGAEAAVTTTAAAGAATTAAAGDDTAAATDLTGVCPDPLVLQTDWYPSPEHGYAYRLIGDAGELDAENGIYRGPLLDTGIDLEIRAGGPYLGFQPDTATMYLDQGIHLAFVSTDEAVQGFADRPTVAVMAPLEINPQILMWDPAVYDFETFEDIGASGATVLYFGGGTYMDYLTGTGLIDPGQIDPSYDGSPARFVVEGDLVQQGFATSEPYRYEHELEEWSKPVDYLLINDSGYRIYSQPLAVRQDALPELSDCLAAVVPIFQQAVVDHWTDPGPANELILQIVEDLASSWELTPGQMDYSAATAVELGVVSNGPDDVVGNFDDARMAEVVELLEGVLDDLPSDLAPEDLYTNQFIDESIGF